MKNPGLRIQSPGLICLEDIPFPSLKDGEVGVKVQYVALCGSDIKLYHGTYKAPHRYPLIMGHEWVGVVEAVTPSAASCWRVGDAVTGECSLFCGACPACALDRNYCASIEKRGITQDGACARHIAVHSRHLHRCPPIRDLKPYTLTEPMSVAIQGVRNRIPHAVLSSARKALIIGAGGIGISTFISLLEFQIPQIVIAAPLPPKTALVDSFNLPNVSTISSLSAEIGPFDLIVEAAGSGVALRRALELAAPRATIACLGHQAELQLDGSLLIKKSLNIIGSLGSAGGFEKAVELIGNYSDLVSRMITRLVPLNDAVEFFHHHLDHECNIKVLINLQESGILI